MSFIRVACKSTGNFGAFWGLRADALTDVLMHSQDLLAVPFRPEPCTYPSCSPDTWICLLEVTLIETHNGTIFSYSKYQWLEFDSTWNKALDSWHCGLLSNGKVSPILKRLSVEEILGSWKHTYQSKETFSCSNYEFTLVFTKPTWRPVNMDTVTWEHDLVKSL